MTAKPNSRLTLADLIQLISNAELTKAKKQDLCSAVRGIGKALGSDLKDIPADPGLLRRRLDLVSSAAVGFSSSRWANIRALLGRALELARPVMPSRFYAPISLSWQALVDDFSRNNQERIKPLIRYLSEHGVEPSDVTLVILLAYREAILNDRLRAKPEKSWDSLTWLWNKCAREKLGWPQIEIPRENKRKTYTLPWTAFPPSLKEDVDRFAARQTGRDFAEDGPIKPLRETSCQTRVYQLRVAASVLVLQGMRPEEITSISVLTIFENYQKILQYFYDKNNQQSSSRISHLATFLVGVARHFVKVTPDEHERLKKQASKLSKKTQGMTAKNRARLRPLDDPEMSQVFLDLPYRIYREMDKKRGSVRNKAVLAQVSIAILILQIAPIRIKNLTQIDIQKNLIIRGHNLYLVFDGHEVKNNQPIDFELPDKVVDMLAWYIREHRSVLMTEPSDALFPGQKNKTKSQGLLGTQISKIVFRYLGMKFNPHLFRHAGGKIFLDIHPGQYEIVRQVLGHKSIDTTTSYYAGAETQTAGRHFTT
ncbi:MAG: site-specific integrase, partial [Methylocystis sp.]